jgi:hypothetical protein
MPNRSRGGGVKTTNQKGLGYDHEQNRDRLLTRHTDGKPCWWCGRPMFGKNNEHKNHRKTRSRHGINNNKADRLLHDTCNKQRGDGSRDHLRPTLTKHLISDNPLGDLAMDWPT